MNKIEITTAMEDYKAINSFPRPNLPDGFRTLLYSLSKEVLQEQPANIYESCAEFFGRRLLNRGDSWITFKERYAMRKKEREEEKPMQKTIPDAVTEDTKDVHLPQQFTPEEEEAAVKIQAGVRGMLVRHGVTPRGDSAHTQRERWMSPRQQLQRDLHTVSESISFAQLEADDGLWEACQRWLHPDEQLQRDYETVAEEVECAHLRDRGLQSGSAFSPAEAAPPQHSDVDVADEPGRPPALPTRGPSIASVQSARHSNVSLADRAPPTPYNIDARAGSLEAVIAEDAPPPSDQPTPPSSPADLSGLAGETAGSELELAGETAGPEAERAGSPPQVTTPRHSEVELAADRQSPPASALQRAGSPPEAATPRHSDLGLTGSDAAAR